jgi:hypothetical protein
MDCPILLRFFLQYLMSVEYLVSSWSIMLESTLMIPKNFVYVWN